MSEQITNMKYFDEQLKLKLQLNLELIEQDHKIWVKHISKIKDKQFLKPSDGNEQSVDDIKNHI
jgi:hypothetical protein